MNLPLLHPLRRSTLARAARIGLVAALAGCAGPRLPPPPTVAEVDLARYAGTWYQVALLPNFFQSQCVSDTRATYRLTDAGVEVVNTCRRADDSLTSIRGRAEAAPGSGNARLLVTFFWPIRGDYWVLALDAAYTSALVGTPDRRYAWILSRTPTLDEARLEQLLARAAELGFDRAAFRRSPVTADTQK